MARNSVADAKTGGIPIKVYLFLSTLSSLFILGAITAFLLFRYVPAIINNQVELRNEAITVVFAESIKKPAMLKNYLQVNKETKIISKLPGVAYAAVINDKGIAMAGFFSDLQHFDKTFQKQIESNGFSTDIFQNELSPDYSFGDKNSKKMLLIGGQAVYDKTLFIEEAGIEVHVGIYVSEVKEAIQAAILSPLTLILLLLVILFGLFSAYLLNKKITEPLTELTSCVDQISRGDMKLKITPKGPKEVRKLADSFGRMQQSIRYIIEKMGK